MSSLCEEHTHLFYPKDINLPPRKLLHRAKHAAEELAPDDVDPYSRDEFRMYEFKIRRCMRSRSHDWTDCPFAHPGEKARRRDPRRFHYSGTPCADFRHGACPRGETCEFAHGVFECWLHPARYRTHACKDGRSCTRKVCFFAHTPRQLRVLPLNSPSSDSSSPSSPVSVPSNPCCAFCQMGSSSPTSTLLGRSHHLSPPMSPPITPNNKEGISKKKMSLSEYLSYKKAVMELIHALGDVNLGSPRKKQIQEAAQFFLSPSPTTSKAKGYEIFNDQDNNPGPDLDWVNDLVM